MYSDYGYDYGGYGEMLSQGLVVGEIVALLAAILLTILLLILVVPEKRRAHLPGFFRGLSDIFNFKGLLIEQIVKALYIFLTLFSIGMGIALLVWAGGNVATGIALQIPAGDVTGWAIVTGLMLILLGPIAIRLVFEGLMLAILLVRNTIQINGKLDKMLERMEERAPASPPADQSAPPWPSGPAGAPPRRAPVPPPPPFNAGGTYTGPAAPGADVGAEAPVPQPEAVPPEGTAPITADAPAQPDPPAAEAEKEPAGVGAHIAPAAPTERPADADTSSQSAAPEEPAPVMVFCTQCGTRYDKSKGGCPNGCVQP